MRKSIVNVAIYDVCSNHTVDSDDFIESCESKNSNVSLNGTNFTLYTSDEFLLGELGALAGIL